MRAHRVHRLRRLPIVVLLALAGLAGVASAEAQEPRSGGSAGDSTVEGRVEDPSGRGWLGIGFREPGAPGDSRSTREGVLISGILRGSPAHRTGIRPGEILLRIDGEPIGPGRLAERARSIRVGDSVSLTLRGPSGMRQVVLVADERPESGPPALDPEVMARVDSVQEAVRRRLEALREEMRAGRDRDSSPWFGRPPGAPERGDRPGRRDLRTRVPPEAPFPRPARPYSLGADFVAGARMVALNEGLAEYFQVQGGVLTVEVLEGSPADESGLRPGDVVIAVEEREVGSVEELRAALLGRIGPEVELRVVRRGEAVEIRLPS